jgi:hypothetical protein
MNEPDERPKTIKLPEENEESTKKPHKAEPLFAFVGGDDERGWKVIGGFRFYVGDGPRWRI